MAVFEGLTQVHFDAYTEEKWSSMVHNLARMKAKDALGSLVERLKADHTIAYGGMVTGASDEIPNISNGKKVDAQWFYWYREQSQRNSLNKILDRLELSSATVFQTAPQDKHIIIGLKLDAKVLSAGIFMAPTASVDRRNLRARLEQTRGREKAHALFQDAPPNLSITFDTLDKPLKEVSEDDLEHLASMLSEQRDETLFIGRVFTSEDSVQLGTSLSEELQQVLAPLEPFYRFLAWSRDNDSIDVGKEIELQKKVKQEKALKHQVGDKVRIVAGLLAGKRGVIDSLDGKGKAKVSVGLMSMQVSMSDLVADS